MSDMPPTSTGAAEQAQSLASIDARMNELNRQADQLYDQLQDFDSYNDSQGRHDARRYKADELRLDRIKVEIERLRDRRQEARQQGDQWVQFATKKAADFMRGRVAGLEERIRDEAKAQFTQQVRSMIDGKTFLRPELQSQDAIEQLLSDRFTYAVGAAYAALANRKADPKAAPESERGLDDESSPPPPPAEDDGFGDDQTARELFGQYQNPRGRKAKTLYDIQMEKFGQGGKPQGGDE